MANALRELILAIKVKVDKAAIKETDAAFDGAAKSATVFETKANSVLSTLQKIGEQIRTNNSLLSKRSADAAALGMKTHPTPPRPGEGTLAPPDISAFVDTRSGPQKVLDAFKAKSASALASAGNAAQNYSKRFDGVVSSVFNARNAIAALGVTMAGAAVGRFFGQIIEAGGALHDMAQRTRVSVETLQVWKSIAADAGADAGAVESAFRKLSKAQAAAARGSKLQAASFKELGVEFKNADGSLRSTEEVLIDTGAALAQMDDDAKATAISTQLLGPAGAALVPAFSKGADAVRKLTSELKENVSLNADEAARLDDVGDALERGTKKWGAMKIRLGVALLPVLESLSAAFENVSKWLLRMTKETQGLWTVIGAVGAAFTGRFVAGMITFASKTEKGSMALKAFGGSLRSATSFALRFVAPLLVLEDFLTFLSGGKSVFGEAMEGIFGEGGAKEAREKLLAWFKEVQTVITDQLLPAFTSIASSELFKGGAEKALNGIVSVLNAIGVALATNKERADALAESLRKNMSAIGLGPSSEERDQALKDGLPGNRKELSGPEKLARKVMTGIFGDPLADPKVRANQDRNRDLLTEKQMMLEGVVPSPATPPVPGASSNVTLNDQRKIEVSVGANATPGATGRAVAGAVDVQLTKDARQTLQAVSH